jgi:hypothetical protein
VKYAWAPAESGRAQAWHLPTPGFKTIKLKKERNIATINSKKKYF